MLTYSSRLLSRTDFVPTFTRIDSTSRGWQGETAHVRSEMLAKHVRNLCGPIFLHCRPRSMVGELRRMLVDAGMDEDDIRTEEFRRY